MPMLPFRLKTRTALFAAGVLAGTLGGCASASRPLVTGKRSGPRQATAQRVGNFPANLLLSTDGHYAFTSDMGATAALWCINAATGRGVSHLNFNNTLRPAQRRRRLTQMQLKRIHANGLYYGLAESPGGTLYAAGGADDRIAVVDVSKRGQLIPARTIHTKKGDFPCGLALDDRGMLYVANNAAGGDSPFGHPGSLAIYSRRTRREIGRYVFKNHGNLSNFPFAVATMAGGGKTFVTSERAGAVTILSTRNPKHIRLLTKIHTGRDPDALLLTSEQQALYVANAGSDSISVIDTGDNRLIHTISLRPPQARDLPGVTPTGLALSPNQNNLYVSCGNMNAVAVVNLNADRLTGYIPAGWYPTGVAAARGRLLICNAKGWRARHPNVAYDPYGSWGNINNRAFVLNIIQGNVQCLPIPNRRDLAADTRAVLSENRLTRMNPTKNPLAWLGIKSGKITHVFYIVKESRTYDQMLGDIKRGNGNPTLCLFGDRVTPNQHALARRFVLLDNLYASGDVGGDGWSWCTQGMANAYVERNVPYCYSGRGRGFDFQGQNNGYITGGFSGGNGRPWHAGEKVGARNGGPAITNVASAGLYIWDLVRRANLPMRTYGVFMSFGGHSRVGAPGLPDNVPTVPGLMPGGHNLRGVCDLDYRRFDMNYSDSNAPEIIYKKTHDLGALYARRAYGKYHAPSRFAEWDREFKLMLKRHPSGHSVPAFEMITYMLDHTAGLAPGQHSPQADVANNDYAVGETVQAISHSPIWKHSAIFIIEADARNGPDHVDCHRTTAYVISPYIRRHAVDAHFYATDSMLRTMELLLNLPPMCQNDAVALPIMDWTRRPRNIKPFEAILPSRRIIEARNPQMGSGHLGR